MVLTMKSIGKLIVFDQISYGFDRKPYGNWSKNLWKSM